MNVTIRGHNIKVSDALEDFTRKKVNKLDRYLPNIRDIRVDLSRQHTSRGENMAIAQITLRHGRGAILRSEEKLQSNERDAVQAAINLAIDKMHRQIERFKGKRSRKGRERFIATIEELDMAETIPELEDYEDEIEEPEYEEPEIIRRKDVALIAMDETEAIEQMELLGHNFFMFLNAETGSINVLYRRAEAGYGLLVPQA
jgi:putative sigma-54 modulation protein